MYNSPNAVLKGIRTEFSKQLANYPGMMFKPFTAEVNSDSNKETYRFLDAFPSIKEWTDSRKRENFKDYSIDILNRHWEFTINADRDTLEDSKGTLGGNILKDVNSSVQRYASFPDKKIAELITDNGTAYDGSTFFGNSHNIDGTNAIDNLYSGTGTTDAQIEADMKGARNALAAYRDKNDEPVNPNPKYAVLIPVHLQDSFLNLANSQTVYISGTKTNILYNTFDIILNHWQGSSDNDWYLINLNAAIKPFIFQKRQGVKWTVKDDVEYKDVLYMSDARYGFGYGAFTSIIKIDN
jgi:phage major head subunit gpT-like protein